MNFIILGLRKMLPKSDGCSLKKLKLKLKFRMNFIIFKLNAKIYFQLCRQSFAVILYNEQLSKNCEHYGHNFKKIRIVVNL